MSVLNNHCSELGEVLGDLRCAFLHDDDILVTELKQEVSIALDAGQKSLWLELCCQLLLLRVLLILCISFMSIDIRLRVLRIARCFACLCDEQFRIRT